MEDQYNSKNGKQNRKEILYTQSMEEYCKNVNIQTVEQIALLKVFDILCNAKQNFPDQTQMKKSQSTVLPKMESQMKSTHGSLYGKSMYSTRFFDKQQKIMQENKMMKRKINDTLQETRKKQIEKIVGQRYFTARDLQIVVNALNYYPSEQYLKDIIWDIDESSLGKINLQAFELMYKRCRYDDTGYEPRDLYNITQYLMFLYHNPANQTEDQQSFEEKRENHRSQITEENTLWILIVQFGKNGMKNITGRIFSSEHDSEEIKMKFKTNYSQNQIQRTVPLELYLARISKLDQENRSKYKNSRIINYQAIDSHDNCDK